MTGPEGKGQSNNLISMAIQFLCQYKILNNIYRLQQLPIIKIFFLIFSGIKTQFVRFIAKNIPATAEIDFMINISLL